ncbi:MAG: toll/interleukin-1 receptor domain-containing protein [Cyanobium sp.]
MNIFLSYASEDREIAEQIQLALAGAKHKVFFDAETLPAGGDYHERIRTAVRKSDLFVFLISPHSIEKGSYCLTELGYARDKWPHPKDRVLPVCLSPVDWGLIPNYLRAVTVFQPEGNTPAEVLATISQRQPAALVTARVRSLAWLGLPLLAAGGWWLNSRLLQPQAPAAETAEQQRTPITVGMNYAVARQRLIQAGWQPLRPQGLAMQWSRGGDSVLQSQLAGAFRKRNWYETLHCYPTGQARCLQQFFDAKGQGLVVETGSGAYSVMPDVIRFYYEDATTERSGESPPAAP